MNKALSKKLEQAARKYSKSNNVLGPKDSFIKGGEYINKHSDKQYTQKDMSQLLQEGVLHFLHAHDRTVSSDTIKTYFKNYIKK